MLHRVINTPYEVADTAWPRENSPASNLASTCFFVSAACHSTTQPVTMDEEKSDIVREDRRAARHADPRNWKAAVELQPARPRLCSALPPAS